MIVTTYWMTWAQAVEFHDWLWERDDDEVALEYDYEFLEETARSNFPDYTHENMSVVFGDRFEQRWIELLLESGVGHRVERCETS